MGTGWSAGRSWRRSKRGPSGQRYGEELVKILAKKLTLRFGKGFSYPNVKRMRQFYLAFPEGSALGSGAGKGSTALSFFGTLGEAGPDNLTDTNGCDGAKKGSTAWSLFTKADQSAGAGSPRLVPPELSWSHYRLLMRVEHEVARRFYEVEAIREGWAVRQLERQIGSMLFERICASKNKDEVLALGKRGQEVSVPADVIKDPVVLEFLDLKENRDYLERDLEQAIIGCVSPYSNIGR